MMDVPFLQPLSPEDYSGEVQQYKIVLDKDQMWVMTCAGGVSQCLVQVPPGVQTLSVSAVTSYGKSPPADVPLRNSGTSKTNPVPAYYPVNTKPHNV